jgi:hypothetical protein
MGAHQPLLVDQQPVHKLQLRPDAPIAPERMLGLQVWLRCTTDPFRFATLTAVRRLMATPPRRFF